MHTTTAPTGSGEAPLLQHLMPRYDATAVRHALIDASPERVWDELHALDLSDIGRRAPLARLMMMLRGVPDAVLRRVRHSPAPAAPERLPLVEPERIGWTMLGVRPGRELVVGGVGHFWTPSIRWRDVAAADFAGFDEPGWAAIAWGFHLTPTRDGRTLLVTECRTHATDDASRRAFRRYWRLMGPFAGYIIGLSPRLVKERAEAG